MVWAPARVVPYVVGGEIRLACVGSLEVVRVRWAAGVSVLSCGGVVG